MKERSSKLAKNVEIYSALNSTLLSSMEFVAQTIIYIEINSTKTKQAE